MHLISIISHSVEMGIIRLMDGLQAVPHQKQDLQKAVYRK